MEGQIYCPNWLTGYDFVVPLSPFFQGHFLLQILHQPLVHLFYSLKICSFCFSPCLLHHPTPELIKDAVLAPTMLVCFLFCGLCFSANKKNMGTVPLLPRKQENRPHAFSVLGILVHIVLEFLFLCEVRLQLLMPNKDFLT